VVGVPLGEIALLVAAVVVAGVATGILAGLFGIGGGAIIVPVLYEIFRTLGVPEEVRMHLCVGTSMAIIIPTTIRSYITHRAKGMVLNDVIRQWAVPAVAGIAVGSWRIILWYAPDASRGPTRIAVPQFNRSRERRSASCLRQQRPTPTLSRRSYCVRSAPGLRQGELIGLQWGDVDFHGGVH